MDGFELNKIVAAVLIALLLAMISSLVGEAFVHPEPLKTNSFGVAIPNGISASGPLQIENILRPIGPLLAKANPADGEKVFKKCISCHTIKKGAPHKAGPNLWDIALSPITRSADYAYSDALRSKKGDWSYENLNHFLAKPREFAPKTKMTFIGISNDQERADLVAYLRQQSDSPKPLPINMEP
ncbi:MAG: cytochrome c family protein [Alphaproteobacteria bacterium]|nr:cytochrome c family protein [Alphaproteobacteria bacterium]